MKKSLKVLAMLLCLMMLATACTSKTETQTSGEDASQQPAAETAEQPAAEETTGEAAEPALSKADSTDLQELAANYNGDIHVVIWGKDSIGDDKSSRGYLIDQMAKEYSAMFDNVTVEYTHQGGYEEVVEKIMAAAAANDLPTAFMAEEAAVKGFEEIVADLNEWVPSKTIDSYMDGLLVSMKGANGELLGAPFARSLPVLYVNKELLAEAGWSGADIKTTDDLMACAKAVHDATGAYGMCVFWDSDVWHWESAIYADGGALLSDDGSTPTFGKDYGYVGAIYLKQIQQGLLDGYLYSPYNTPDPSNTRNDVFCSGQVAMTLTSSNSMPMRATKLAEAGYTMETYVQPAGQGGVQMTSGGSNWLICDSASEEEKLIAGGFLAYMAETEQILRIAENTGSMMITEDALASQGGQKLLQEHPYFQAIYDSIPYLHQRANTPYWTEMYLYAADKLEQFSLYPADTDVDAMVDDIELKFQQIIQDNAW